MDIVDILRDYKALAGNQRDFHREQKLQEAISEIESLRQQLAEQTSARNTHDVLCERKTQSVIDDGYSLMGYVLKRNDNWCVINGSAVRWLANKDMWNLMHPDSADNQSVEVLLEALRSARDLLSAVDGISRNNFSQLASEEIQAIDKLISSYKPTEG